MQYRRLCRSAYRENREENRRLQAPPSDIILGVRRIVAIEWPEATKAVRQ